MMSDAEPSKPRANHAKKGGRLFGMSVMWVLNLALALTTVAVLLLGAAVFYFKTTPIAAPDWARAKIEARLAEVLPQARVSFGEMVFVMEEGWQPRVRLRDVAVRDTEGREVIALNELKATFDSASMMEGAVQPKEISLSGITANVNRAKDGSISLSAVTGVRPDGDRRAASVPQLIAQMDEVLANPNLRALQSVEVRALTLRYEDARAGRAWTVDGGRLVLDREGDDLSLNADLALLSGGAGVATLAVNYTSKIGQTAAQFGARFDDVGAQDIASMGPAVAWLGVLRAPISGSVRTGLHADGRFRPLAATLQIGAGVVQPNEGTEPIPFEGGRSYFSYDPAARVLAFDTLSVRSKWMTGEASGSATLGLDAETGQLRDLVGQINLAKMSGNPGGLYRAPVQLAGADVDFRLELNPFRITLGRAQINDAGRTLVLDGTLAADPDGWRVALDGRMDGLSPARLMALWPERAVPKTRGWLAENIKAGEVSNIDLALRRAPGTPPQTYVGFDYDKATVRFLKTLPPVTQARGHFTLDGKRLVVSMDEGVVTPPTGGAITVTGSSFILPDISVKGGAPSVIRLQTASNITAALSLLNMPPLSVMDKINLPVALAEGRAEMAGTLAVSLMKGAKVDYHMAGDLTQFRSDTLVKNRTVEARTLKLTADTAGVSITGDATLDGIAFAGGLQQPIGAGAGAGRVTGTIPLNTKSLASFGIKLPEGSIRGEATGRIDIGLPKGAPPTFKLTSNLRGARVAVPQVSWVKPANRDGTLEVSGRFTSPATIDTLRVGGDGLQARGSVRLKPDASLERVRFDSVSVGNWLDVPLDLVGQGKGKPLQVVLRGGSLDLTRAQFGKSETSGPAGPPMEVRLDRLKITDAIALTGMRGLFDTGKGLDGKFEAQLNGAAAVQGSVVPQNGRSAVRLQSADAGAVLRAAGLLKQVVGGNLSLLLLPVGTGGAFDGRLTADDVRIKDAPGIAALLNAVSVVGLVNELNGDGIYFDDVEASFRLTPNRLTLTEASAVGASMGLSMDGTYALDTGQLGMQGVISPVYLLNGIGSLFTRKGEGLIGFNYTLTGAAKSPKVGVNPLSALTPAMFREIFRAPPPELPAVEGVTESTLPDLPDEPEQRPVARRPEGR